MTGELNKIFTGLVLFVISLWASVLQTPPAPVYHVKYGKVQSQNATTCEVINGRKYKVLNIPYTKDKNTLHKHCKYTSSNARLLSTAFEVTQHIIATATFQPEQKEQKRHVRYISGNGRGY